jgi:hypothetical protein
MTAHLVNLGSDVIFTVRHHLAVKRNKLKCKKIIFQTHAARGSRDIYVKALRDNR